MGFRKEIKYRLSSSEVFQIQKNLMELGMHELHPERLVSSCYFDTNNFTLFRESEEGTLPRKKIRIRWYNNVMKLQKEQKVSSIEGRYKTVTEIASITNKRELLKLTYFDQAYGCLTPKLIISYFRQYFKLESLRLTFDQKISYHSIHSDVLPTIYDKECVMEVKVPMGIEEEYVKSLIPFQSSRFSKYARGMLHFGI